MRIELFVLLIVLGVVGRYRRRAHHRTGVHALSLVERERRLRARGRAPYLGALTPIARMWETTEIRRHAV